MPAVIDFHTHIFAADVRAHRERYLERDATLRELYSAPRANMAGAEELLAAMDEDGVDVSVVLGMGWTDPGLARECNDYVIEAVASRPDRLVGFADVNPAWGDAAVLELERCVAAGLRGLGELHPDTQGFDITDPVAMAPLMAVARPHRLPVTVHSSEPVGHAYAGKGRTTPERLLALAHAFPDIRLVLAHWGGGLPFYCLMPEVAGATSQVYYDTAASPLLYHARVFDAVAALVGAGKVLVGSDYPLVRHRRLRRQVEESGLSAFDRQAVLGGNAQALLAGW